MSEIYELVIFTASLAMYADAVIDYIDPDLKIRHRLYRDSCNNFNGTYVKDLSRLGRKLKDVIIIDNSPNSYRL